MNHSTFFYHAHGVALGGTIVRPFNKQIEAQAATSLPITGGVGVSRAERFRFEGIVSFESAHTEVSGSQSAQDGSYNTVVTTTVEGLNIMDVLTADRIVARISSLHPVDTDEPKIIPLGSEIVNLRIGGHPAEVELDTNLFCSLDTFRSFKERFETDREFQQMTRKRFLWGELDKDVPDYVQQRYKWQRQQPGLPVAKGIAQCSLLKDLKCACPELKRYGHILVLPQIGKIHIAELLLMERSRRLTMLRLDLGSPVEGTVTVAGDESNGVGY